jgi:hypothetical protein
MLLKKVLEMLKMSFCKWVSDTTIKPFIILGVTLFWLWRISLVEYLLVLRVLFPLVADGQMYYGYLYQLPLSCDGWCLGLWARVIPYVSSNAFVGDDHQLALYLNSVWVCVDLNKLLSLLSIWTRLMYLWCELLCNIWWWPLNLLRSWLVREVIQA